MMRLGGDVDQKLLGELFYQYINVEEDFITALFMSETRPGAPCQRRCAPARARPDRTQLRPRQRSRA